MFDLWAMGKSTEGGVQPTQSAASDISYFCLISSCSLSHLFQNPVILPAILPFLRVLLVYLFCFLQTKLWIWVISIYFTVSPVWSGDCEREGLTLRWLAPRLALKLIRNHHHREGFFLLGGALTYFMLPTSPAPWKGIWQHHTFLLNHQDWLNQRVGFLPPPKIMSRSPQSQGSSLRKSWWWRYPKAEAGGSSGHVRRHERVGGSRCHVTAAIAPSSARESVVRCRGGWRRRVELLRSAVCSCLPEYQRREW